MTDASELNKQIKQLEKLIKLSNCLKRLNNNKDFKELIHCHYFKEFPLTKVDDLHSHESGSAAYAAIIKDLEAVSAFRAYLLLILENGQLAEAELDFAKKIPDSELY